MTENQNPEQQARDRIDAQLRAAGWAVQPGDIFEVCTPGGGGYGTAA